MTAASGLQHSDRNDLW